jgi:uncharacterized protein YndB with AHSA1/START domain
MSVKREPALSPVIKRIFVRCGVDDAFRFFTADFGQWWPSHTHSVIAMSSDGMRVPMSCTFEPRLGGRIIEHGAAGEEYRWGTVQVWDPPARVVFSWHPGYDEGASQTVDVTFTKAPGGTDVVLTHSGWERLGERAALARERYNNGWEAVFAGAYRDHVEQHK